MLILGIDTSGRNGSVALVRASDQAFEVVRIVTLEGGLYSAQLVPAVATILETNGLTLPDLDMFAVASGPGSFTGLRVGLAAVKAWAEVLVRPVVPVSVLEAVASATHEDGRTIAALDAARKEVFVGEYEVVGGTAKRVCEALVTQLEFSQLLERSESAQLITTDHSISELARFHMHVMEIERPRADEYARLGWYKLRSGEAVPPEALDANYIRRSDAEIFSKPIG